MRSKANQAKIALIKKGTYREQPERSINDSLWGWDLGSNLRVLLPVAARLLIFTVIVGCSFSRSLQSSGGGDGIVQGKRPQSILFLPGSS